MIVTTAFASIGIPALLGLRSAAPAPGYIFSRRALRSSAKRLVSPGAPYGGRSLQGAAYLLCCLRCAPAMIKALGVEQGFPRLPCCMTFTPALLTLAAPFTAMPPA